MDDSSLISAVDLLPTFCEVAGVKLPESYKPDGISQISTLMGKVSSARAKPLFWKMAGSWPIRNNQPYHLVSYAIVYQNHKLLANRDSSYVELFDITTDPYEKTDLKEAEPEVVQRLLSKLDEWKSTLPAKPTGNVFSAERSQTDEKKTAK